MAELRGPASRTSASHATSNQYVPAAIPPHRYLAAPDPTVAAEHRLTVVALRDPRGAWEVQPGVDRTLEVGTRAQMLVPGDRCEVVRELNGGA